MDLSLHLVRFDWPGGPETFGDVLAQLGAAADATGCAALSVMDHFFQLPQRPPVESQPMLEGYTTLGFLAGATSRVRLRMLVGGVTYRHPGVLAKQITTLDVLSRGRAQLGLGAAWYEREHVGLGIPFPALSERYDRLEETLQICAQMWSGDDGPYSGRHYQLAETLCIPPPVTRPRPPVLIGGGGERKTLRLVAKYADACNLSASLSPAEVAHKLEVLRKHCDDVGRDPRTIATTLNYTGLPLADCDVDAFVDAVRRYSELGVDELVAVVPDVPDPDVWVRTFCGPARERIAAL